MIFGKFCPIFRLIQRAVKSHINVEVMIMVKRKANHVINGMNDAKSQGKGAGYIENDQLVLTEEERQNNKKEKQTNSRNTLKRRL